MNEATIPVDVKGTGTVTRFTSTLKQCAKCGFAGEPEIEALPAEQLTRIRCPVCEHAAEAFNLKECRDAWNVPPA